MLQLGVLEMPIRAPCPHAFGDRAAQNDNETKDQKDDRKAT